MIDGEPQADPPATRFRLHHDRGRQVAQDARHGVGHQPRVHQSFGVCRVVGDRTAHHHHRAPRGARLPPPCEDVLRAGQRSQTGLDASQDQQRRAGPTPQPVHLEAPAGDGVRGHGGLNGHAPIVPCAGDLVSARRYHRSMISRADVEHVAGLARLGLTEDEIDLMRGQLNRILEAIGQLQSVDTSAVGPTAQVIALENVMRDDEVLPGMSRDAALANAPLREGDHLRVPVVLEEGR